VTFPEIIQNALCGFLTEGFEGLGAPVVGSGSMGVSFWNVEESQVVQVRTKWAEKLDEIWKETAQIPTPPPACAPGDMCMVGDAVFNQENGEVATAPANCDNADLPTCTTTCSDHCLDGQLKTDPSPLIQASCADFICPAPDCVPGNTCKVGTNVFNSAGEADTLPVNCRIGNLDPCAYVCSAESCSFGALNTGLTVLAKATCDAAIVAGFECPVCVPGNTCRVGMDVFNWAGEADALPVNCRIGNLDPCTTTCSESEHCLNGVLKTDHLSPLVQATCAAAILSDFKCPECVPGNTCAFANGVFNSAGEITDAPANCLVGNLPSCTFDECSDYCFNGLLSTDVSALVKAACASFTACPI
jgi:hypothetical protein